MSLLETGPWLRKAANELTLWVWMARDRQLTAVFGCMKGEFLPSQIICGRKTTRCLPPQSFQVLGKSPERLDMLWVSYVMGI